MCAARRHGCDITPCSSASPSSLIIIEKSPHRITLNPLLSSLSAARSQWYLGVARRCAFKKKEKSHAGRKKTKKHIQRADVNVGDGQEEDNNNITTDWILISSKPTSPAALSENRYQSEE